MATIDEMLAAFRSINLEQEIAKAIEITETAYLDAQRQQLYNGLDGNGLPLPSYHSSKYARAKADMNPLPGLGTPDYKLTGALYSNMYVDFIGDLVQTKSNVSYFGDLTARGGDPFTLNENSKEKYSNDNLYPVLMQNLSEITGVGLG